MSIDEKRQFVSRSELRDAFKGPTDPTPGLVSKRYKPAEIAELKTMFKNPYFVSKRHYLRKMQDLQKQQKLSKDPQEKLYLEQKIKFLQKFRVH